MKRNMGFAGIFVSALLIIFGLVFGSGAWHTVYSGVTVFDTEQEYSVFKQVVEDSGSKILDADVLSSESPIVVAYQVREANTAATTMFGCLSLLGGVALFVYGVRMSGRA